MISLENISKSYKTLDGVKLAVSNVSLKINKGDIFGIIGESGAGKSTLLRVVNFLENPDTGIVKIEDQDLNKLSIASLNNLRSDIGMIFQHFNLLNSKNVFDNVALPLNLKKIAKAIIKSETLHALQLVGLKDYANFKINQLSGGQKQRVAIARALITHPKILVCDEATSALDPKTTDEILELLLDLQKKLNLTILLITHEMEVVRKVCNRLAVMSQGEIIEQGWALDLFVSPKMPLTKHLLGITMREKLPAKIEHNISADVNVDHSYPLLQLIFNEDTSEIPIISKLTKKLNLDINILQAEVRTIQNVVIGMMVVQLITTNKSQAEDFMQELTSLKVIWELIGYVPRNL